MNRAGGVALAVAATTLAACTLLVDLDGLADPKAGAALDGGAEGGAADAGADGDASADAGPSNPCTLPNVLYCTRFDDPTALGAFRRETDPTTRIEVQPSVFFSAPASATFTIESSGNTSADATLGITVGSDIEHVSFRGRVRIEQRVPVEGRLLAMRVGGGSTILLQHDGDVHESGVAKLGTVPAVPSDQWVEVRMELDASASTPRVTVTIGDATPTQFAIGTGAWTRGEVTAVFGISETSTPTPSSSWLVRWDDVVIQKL